MFTSSVLGEVRHPLNILTEYLELFNRRHKIKAQILSWLDSWYVSGHEEWIYICNSDLANIFGVVPFTIRKHLTELTRWGILKRRPAKRWPTDKAYSYSIDLENLGMVIYNFIAKVWLNTQLQLKAGTLTNSLIGNFLLIDESILTYRQVKNDLSTGKNLGTILNPVLDSSLKSNLINPPPTPQRGEEGGEENFEMAKEEKNEEPTAISPPTEKAIEKPLLKSDKGFRGDKYSGRRRGDSKPHPALVYAEEATPWLLEPEREGEVKFRPEFLEFFGGRFLEKFHKKDIHEALADFRASLLNKPDRCKIRWEEFCAHHQHHAQNMVVRAVSGGVVDQEEIDKIEANKIALTQVMPIKNPALPKEQPILEAMPEEIDEIPDVNLLQSWLDSGIKMLRDRADRLAKKWGLVVSDNRILERSFDYERL